MRTRKECECLVLQDKKAQQKTKGPHVAGETPRQEREKREEKPAEQAQPAAAAKTTKPARHRATTTHTRHTKYPAMLGKKRQSLAAWIPKSETSSQWYITSARQMRTSKIQNTSNHKHTFTVTSVAGTTSRRHSESICLQLRDCQRSAILVVGVHLRHIIIDTLTGNMLCK